MSAEYEADLRHERELAGQRFDMALEKASQDGRREWLGDFARQQELVFEMKAK